MDKDQAGTTQDDIITAGMNGIVLSSKHEQDLIGECQKRKIKPTVFFKPWIPPPKKSPRLASTTNSRRRSRATSSARASGAVFDVELVLDRRVQSGAVEYLCRWKGYDASFDSWEPLENFTGESHRLLTEKFAPDSTTGRADDNNGGISGQGVATSGAPQPQPAQGLTTGFDKPDWKGSFDKIITVIRNEAQTGVSGYLIKWKGSHLPEVVERDVVNAKIPYDVISYYEARTVFPD